MHSYSLRSLFILTVPSLTALLGLIWYFGRKKKDDAEENDRSSTSTKSESAEVSDLLHSAAEAAVCKVEEAELGSKDLDEETLLKRPHHDLPQGKKETARAQQEETAHDTVPISVSPKPTLSQDWLEVSGSGDASTLKTSLPGPKVASDSSAEVAVCTQQKILKPALETSSEADCHSTRSSDQEAAGGSSPAAEAGVASGHDASFENNIPSHDVTRTENKTQASGTSAVLSNASIEVSSDKKQQIGVPPDSEGFLVESFVCATSASTCLFAENPQSEGSHVSPGALETAHQIVQSSLEKTSPDLLALAPVLPEKNALMESVSMSHSQDNASLSSGVSREITSAKSFSSEKSIVAESSDVSSGQREYSTVSNSVLISSEKVLTSHEGPTAPDVSVELVCGQGSFTESSDRNVDDSTALQGTSSSSVMETEQDNVMTKQDDVTAVCDVKADTSDDIAKQVTTNLASVSSPKGDLDSSITGSAKSETTSLSTVSLPPTETTKAVSRSTGEQTFDTLTPAESGNVLSSSDQSDKIKTKSGKAALWEREAQGNTSSHDSQSKSSSRLKSDRNSPAAKQKSHRYNKWSDPAHEKRDGRKDSGGEVFLDHSPSAAEASPATPITENGRGADAGSPSCDTNSEESNDSGRGGSVGDNLVALSAGEVVHYEFNFPSDLCGRLIGRGGRNIHFIKEESGATVALASNPFTPDFQICRVQGVQAEVDKALTIIRKKFPAGQYPQLDMSPIGPPRPTPIIIPEVMQLNLPEGVSVEVVVSAIVNAGHIFVQQPTHPSFPSLERLQQYMNSCYSDQNVPTLPRPVEGGVICASESEGQWFRAQVMQVYPKDDACDIKFVDYGGYARVPIPSLRQIRSDFMTLPFQAVECYLANITPLQEEDYFSEQASLQLAELTGGKVLQGQVILRGEDTVPYVHIYQVSGHSVLLINREMVNREVVRWIEIL